MKDTFYFSHDYNTRSDQKIKKLIAKHGFEGYGLYWAIVEDLYQNANALQTDYESIAFDLRTESNIIKSIINDFNLFTVNGEYFSSDAVQERINKRLEKSEKARESAIKSWQSPKRNANAEQTHSDSNAIKGKERKGKEKKKDNISATKLPDYMNFDSGQFVSFLNGNHKNQYKCQAIMERYKYKAGVPYYYDKKEVGSLASLLKKISTVNPKDPVQSFIKILNFMVDDDFYKNKITFAEINSSFNSIATKMKNA